MPQQELFENELSSNRRLVINQNQPDKPLSKGQKAFNKLVKQIETLQKDLENTTHKFDQGLKNYADHLFPIEQEKNSTRVKLIKILYKCLQTSKGKLNRKEMDALPLIIENELDVLMQDNHDLFDSELKKIFDEISDNSFDQKLDNDFDDMKMQIEMSAEEMGIDIDLSDLNRGDDPAKIAIRLKEAQEKIKDQIKEGQKSNSFVPGGARSRGRKPNANKLLREAAILEAKAKNIHIIYKQLAKALHPDLEIDENLKKEKEILMQQVIKAYQEKDLHGLLKLEMKLLMKEESHLDALTDEKLTVYNEILKEQVQQLNSEIAMVSYHPKYKSVLKWKMSGVDLHINWSKAKKLEQQVLVQMENDINALSGLNYVKVLKQIIQVQIDTDTSNTDHFGDDFFDFIRKNFDGKF